MKKIVAATGDPKIDAMDDIASQVEALFTTDIIPATGGDVGEVQVLDYTGMKDAVKNEYDVIDVMKHPMYQQTAQVVRGLQAKGNTININIATNGAKVVIIDSQDGYVITEVQISRDGIATATVFGDLDLTAELLRLLNSLYYGLG